MNIRFASLLSLLFVGLFLCHPLQCQTNDLYQQGLESEKGGDESTALSLFEQAAQEGSSEAMIKIGDYYYFAKGGLKRNESKAVKWYEKAAEAQNPEAMYKAGKAGYEYGLRANKMSLVKRAIQWVVKSAEADYVKAQMTAAEWYTHGILGRSIDKTIYWYTRAGDNGNTDAQRKLANLYFEGEEIEKDLKKAEYWFRKAAEEGNDADSQFQLGMMYETGSGVNKDITEAMKWYKMAAEQQHSKAKNNLRKLEKTASTYQAAYKYMYAKEGERDEVLAFRLFKVVAESGNPKAMTELGHCFLRGRGTDADPEKAYQWYHNAADKGESEAQVYLGVCYEEGIGVDKNDDEAMACFSKAAFQDNPIGQYRLGEFYYQGRGGVDKDYSEAVKWFIKSAVQGYPDAQVRLGLCYYDGIGFEKNDSEAVAWIKKAAEQGYTLAQRQLGDFYAKGIGVQADPALSVAWFRKAAEEGNDAVAQYRLGLDYEKGLGVQQSNGDARSWYLKAAMQGYSLASENLQRLTDSIQQNSDNDYQSGLKYMYAKGIKKDEALANKLFLRAAEFGNEKAMAELGLSYQKGRGLDIDPALAFKWMNKSAQQENAESQANIGLYYDAGFGVEKNVAEALNWFKKAAAQDNPTAVYMCGEYYYLGKGVKKDPKTAVEYYKRASELGVVEAQICLAKCLDEGTGIQKNIEEAVKWYTTAAQNGRIDAQKWLGKHFASTNNMGQAIYWYRKAAEEGNDEKAQLQMGIFYETGLGVKQDAKEAMKWYSLSADRGSIKARENYKKLSEQLALQAETDLQTGLKLMYSKGADKDVSQAFTLFERAAEFGNVRAMPELGRCYQLGYGTKADPDQAVKWYKKSAELGLDIGEFFLGWCYDNGFGIRTNQSEAVRWYQKAADQGLAIAQREMMVRYMIGRGVKQDAAKAAVLCRKAADQGDEVSMFYLGRFYESGLGVQRDYKEALAWYDKAAERGVEDGKQRADNLRGRLQREYQLYVMESLEEENNRRVKEGIELLNQGKYDMAVPRFREAYYMNVEARYWLGYCYEKGLGLRQNYSSAIDSYKSAANSGYKKANDRLHSIGDEVINETKNILYGVHNKPGFDYYEASREEIAEYAERNGVSEKDIHHAYQLDIYWDECSMTVAQDLLRTIHLNRWEIVEDTDSRTVGIIPVSGSVRAMFIVSNEEDVLSLTLMDCMIPNDASGYKPEYLVHR